MPLQVPVLQLEISRKEKTQQNLIRFVTIPHER